MLGNNMFAYCRNNPVCRKDTQGTEDTEEYWNDGSNGDAYNEPIDPEDMAPSTPTQAPVGQSYGTTSGGSNPGSSGAGQSNSGGNNGSTPIYRYGGNSPEKLTPTANDVATDTGLSFSTKSRAGAAATTIEEINASGCLYAVQDTRTHVSVYPVNATVLEWYTQGAASLWTQTLVQLVTLV